MKIAILVKNYQPLPFELGEVNAEVLAHELVKKNFDVRIINLNGKIPKKSLLHRDFTQGLKERFDVVYASSGKREDVLWYLVFALRNRNTLFLSLFDNTLEPITSNFIGKFLFTTFYNLGIITPLAVSKAQQEYIYDHLNLRPDILYPATKVGNETIKVKNNNFTLLFIGSTNDYKRGLDLVINALPEVRSQFPKVRLVVLSKYRNYIGNHSLKDLAKKNGVYNIIEWKNGVFNMQKEYKRARMLVLPYTSFKYCPPIPFTIIEAISYGIPVISTPFGSIPEIIGRDMLVEPEGDIAKKIIKQLRFRQTVSLPINFQPGTIAENFIRLISKK